MRLKKSRFKAFYHADCYRLESEKDVNAIGLDEAMNNPENIVLVEWARRIKSTASRYDPRDIYL